MRLLGLFSTLVVSFALSLTANLVSAQSHFVRLGDIGAETVGRIAIAGLGDGRSVTAIADEAGNLKLIVWDVTSDGKFTRRGSIEAGKTSVFALATLGTSDAITAVRQENGNLRLIDWTIDQNGNLTRKGSIDAGPVDRIAIAPVGPSRVVTANVASGATKLIVWDKTNAGQFTRKGDANSAAGSRASVAALSAGQIVLAVRDATGKLDVSSWSLNQAGDLSPQQSAKGSQVTEIAITNTALDRAVTACNLSDGTLEVAAWDVQANGKVTAASSAKAGLADNIALAAMGSTKVVTALRENSQALKLISWQVVDTVRRLDSIAAGPVGRVAAVTLGWDRVITAVQDNAKDLKLIDFADFSVGLLRSQWVPAASGQSLSVQPSASVLAINPAGKFDDERLTPPQRINIASPKQISRAGESAVWKAAPPNMPGPPPPGPAQVQAPPPDLVVLPSLSGVDPMVAVGKSFVIVSEDHSIEFLYKTGPKAGQQLDSKAGEQTLLSSKSFFDGFFRPTNADGSVNRNNINLHGRFPPSFDPAVVCMPTSSSPSLPCMNEAYDTRVIYDPYRGRFVVMSHMRGSARSGATTLVARRYVAIAVSRTEDLTRYGFRHWQQWPAGLRNLFLRTNHNEQSWDRLLRMWAN